LPEIFNKFAYGVLPERMYTFTTLFPIDTHIIHGFTFRTYLLSTYEFRYMLKRTMNVFRVLCALRIEGNVKKPVQQIGRVQWSNVAEMARRLFLITNITSVLILSCFASAVTE